MPFASILGHGHAVALLQKAIVAGQVPQSLLIAGPEGVGKRSLALALAQAVNCPARRDGDACGRCATCDRIARGVHSDVALLTPGDQASIRIKPLRERVLDVVGYRPFEAERRVFVIDPADLLTAEAQDALLKTLEEPPPSALLILVSAYPDTLRATVQSRCRRIRLGPLGERDLARVLVERCGVDQKRAAALASVAGGSVGQALARIEEVGDLAEDRDAAMGLVVAAAERGPNVGGRLKAAAALVQHAKQRRAREAVGTRLAIASSLLRDVGAIAAGQAALVANADLAGPLGRLAPAFDVRRVSAGFAALARAQADLDRSASPKIVADWVALAL